jgi:hypothetical protein
MRAFRIALSIVFLLLGVAAPVVLAAGPYTEEALGALSWTASQQQPDGSFLGFGPGSTADAVFAICAAGGDPNGFLSGGNSPITFLAANVDGLTATAGGTAKAIMAVVCAGKDPRDFGGVDLLVALADTYDPATGQYGTDLAGHAFALLALASTGQPVPGAAVAWLRDAQTPEGGWSWSGSPAAGGADTNSAALAVQALVVSGVSTDDTAIQAAVAYLHTQQNDDGGFPYAKPSPYGTDTDANSTAYVIQGLIAAGEEPEGPAWTAGENTPLTALLALRTPSGGLQWQAAIPGENALATYQAVPALTLKPFPLSRTTVATGAGVLPATGMAAVGAVAVSVVAALVLGLGLLLRSKGLVRR